MAISNSGSVGRGKAFAPGLNVACQPKRAEFVRVLGDGSDRRQTDAHASQTMARAAVLSR